MSSGFLQRKVYANYWKRFPRPFQNPPWQKDHGNKLSEVQLQKCDEGPPRAAAAFSGQLWGPRSEFGIACQICETVFFLVVVVVLAVFFSKELFVQILCLLNQVPKLISEEGRMGLAFALCETFCAFKKWFCSLWHIYWSTWSLHLTDKQVPGDRNLSSIKKVEGIWKPFQSGGKSYWLRFLGVFFSPKRTTEGKKMSSLNVLNSFWRGLLNIFTVSNQPGMALRPPYQACATLQSLWLIVFQETMDTESIIQVVNIENKLMTALWAFHWTLRHLWVTDRSLAGWDWSLRLERTKCFEHHSEKTDASEGWP